MGHDEAVKAYEQKYLCISDCGKILPWWLGNRSECDAEYFRSNDRILWVSISVSVKQHKGL